MNKSNKLILTVAIFSAVLGVAASHFLQKAKVAHAQSQSLDQNVQGTTAPDFELPDLAGNMVSKQAFKGQTVLLNFWATWCGPCRKEIPDLNALHKQVISNGGSVVGIALDQADAVENFIKDIPIDYPLLIADGLEGTRLTQEFGNPAGLMPFSVLLSPTGEIEQVHLGVIEQQQGLELFQPFLNN